MDHSDSDSGDGWTLIENNSLYGDDAPDVPDHPTESVTENHEKDEDTDGISIITDSDPESSSPCQISYEHYLAQKYSTTIHHIPQFITVDTDSDLHKIIDESEKEQDDFLGESHGKHKTYVHRRNKRINTVLNIIMLGSVITAAGVAIGHMWGGKTDCSMHTTTNVNKILSNLYKLQEENAYLWRKLKELTALNNHQMNQQKVTLKQNKCKKVFEEPLINSDSIKGTKCVDDSFVNFEISTINSHMAEGAKKEKPDEFLNETEDLVNGRISYADSLKYVGKVKTLKRKENQIHESKNKYVGENNRILNIPFYDFEMDSSYKYMNTKETNSKNKNKSKEKHTNEINLSHESKNTNRDSNHLTEEYSLDEDFINNENHQKRNKRENNALIPKRSDYDNNKTLKIANRQKIEDSRNYIKGNDVKEHSKNERKERFQMKHENLVKYDSNEKISKNKEVKNRINITRGKVYNEENKRNKIIIPHIKNKDFEINKLTKQGNDAKAFGVKHKTNHFNDNIKIKADCDYHFKSSEEDVKKDDRYTGQKQKQERKKYDRQQLNKKNKKRNKYEQWEMKVFKDLEDISVSSPQDKEYLPNEPNLINDKIRQLEDNIKNNINTATDNLNPKTIKKSMEQDDNLTWLDKRANFRKEARQKVKEELFDKNGVNAAGWYFRRMRKRERSRGKGDNST